MENLCSIEAVDSSLYRGSYRKPLYDSYCIANIPSSVQKMFGISPRRAVLPSDSFAGLNGAYDKVVVILFDGFGWRFLRHYLEHGKCSSLKTIFGESVVSKLTSLFPSTTTCCDSMMLTGLLPVESGLAHWQYYDPRIGGVINPFMFSYAGKEKGGLLSDGVKLEDVFPAPDFLISLLSNDVSVECVYPERVATGFLMRSISKYLPVYQFKTFEEGCKHVRKRLKESEERSYFYICYDQFDRLLHRDGLEGTEVDSVVDEVFSCIKQCFFDGVASSGKTLFLLMADHGHSEIDNSIGFYFDKDCSELMSYLKRDRRGEVIAAAGGIGSCLLYANDGQIDGAQQVLANALSGKCADVVRLEELIDENMFGSTKLSWGARARYGDITVLQRGPEPIFWSGENNRYYPRTSKSEHGGMTPKEMDTLMLAWER